MKVRQRNQWFSFLLALAMIVGMLLPMSTVHAANDGEDAVSVTQEPARASSSAYPALTNLVEGTEIVYRHVYFFHKNGKVESRSVALDPENCRYNTRLLEDYKSDTSLQRVVSYDNGMLMYWTRTENDFLDLSGLEGRSLTLILFDNLKLSALYAPGVDLRLMVTNGAYVTFNHSTRYKNKTAYCPQNGATGAVIDLAQSEGSLNGCGTFELCGNGELGIVTTRAPRKTSPDYAIVAKNTSVLEDAALSIVCGNSYRDVSSLIQTISLTIDTTRDVSLYIKNPRTNAAAWSCHMNNFKLVNAKSLNVFVQRGSGGWILFGNNGETDPAKVFKYYRSTGKIGNEWYIAGKTDSSGCYNLTLDRRDYLPKIRFKLNSQEVKGGQTVWGLKAGLGYEMSAEIVYMPQWMQKLKDAGRIRFDFYGLLCKPGLEEGYEGDPYKIDFYVDRTGKHGVEFYWTCRPSIDRNYVKPKTEASVLYQTYIEFDVQMNESVSGKQYIYNVQLLQAGGEFTEATNATHKISLHPDTLAKCYTEESYSIGIPSEWRYLADEDAYIMYFWVMPRHGYEFADSTATADNGVTLNVQHTKVTNRSFTNGEKALVVNLVAKRKLTDVRGTLKNFRLGIDAGFTEIVSNEPKKYTFQDTVVYDPGYGNSYGVEAGQLREGDTCYVYFDVKPGVGYYLPENASVKVIQPAGYRANGIFDSAETYSTVYKGDWISYSPINQKYRVSQLLEPNSEGVKYDTNIRVQEPVPGDRPAVYGSYIGPTNLPYNMKVLSMQWRKIDHTPMGSFDRFEIGKSYILDLRIGFEGGEEMGYVYPKNWKDFKVNGKSVNAWMEYDDNTNGHFLRVYESYKVTDPSANGSVSGTVKNYNSASDKVTIQLIQQGYSEPAYETIVPSGTKVGNQYTASYTISGVASGTYTMRVLKKNHVTREYTVTVTTGTKTQNAEIRLLGDVNGDGRVNAMDYTRLLKHVNETQPLTDAYALKCSDVNGDKRVNAMDYTRLLKHVNETQPLW